MPNLAQARLHNYTARTSLRPGEEAADGAP